MKILVVKAAGKPTWADIENKLASMAEMVDGWPKVMATSIEGVLLVGDVEACKNHKPRNFYVETGLIAGDVFFVGGYGETFTDLTEEQAKQVVAKYLPSMTCPPMPK